MIIIYYKLLRCQETRLWHPSHKKQDPQYSWVCSRETGLVFPNSSHRLSHITSGIYTGATGVLVITHITPSPAKTNQRLRDYP